MSAKAQGQHRVRGVHYVAAFAKYSPSGSGKMEVAAAKER